MQALFGEDAEGAKAFRASISEARFARYLRESKGDEASAIMLYRWNAQLSQCLYMPLQVWEVALRNRLNTFLKLRFTRAWPYDPSLRRGLSPGSRGKLEDTIGRLDARNQQVQVPTDRIVADLSAGFWVSLLAQRYDQTFRWRRDLHHVFPHLPAFDRASAHDVCTKLLKLRNRVAHHEPILQLPLREAKDLLDRLTGGMCPASATYMKSLCSFEAVWASRPPPLAEALAAKAANRDVGDAVAQTAQRQDETISAVRSRPLDPG